MFYKKKFLILGILLTLIFISLISTIIISRVQKRPVSQISPTSLIDKPNIVLTPLSTDFAGVKADSKFSINTDPKNLKVSPSLPFTFEKQSDGSYLISFSKLLDPNQRYDFVLPVIIKEAQAFEYKWSYMVHAPPEILYTSPRNRGSSAINNPIEFYFTNNNVDARFKDYLEITPPVDGRIEKHLNSITFVPQALAPNTIYTVRVKKGLPYNDNSASLERDYVFQFSTNVDNSNHREISSKRIIYNFSPDEIPAIDLEFYGNNKPTSVNLEVYSYNEADFLNCLKNLNIPDWASYNFIPNCSTPPEAKLIAPVTVMGENNYNNYINFPDKLGEGYYLIKINQNNKPFFALLQISNLSTGIKFYEKQSLVWVNDVASKSPVANASVVDIKNNFGTTDDKGVLIIDNNKYPQDYLLDYLKISYNSKNLYVPVGQFLNTHLQTPKYWNYFYVDRDLYLPTDSINFWGFAKPKDNSNSNSRVIVDLLDSNSTTITTKTIDLSPDHTFIGKFDFKNLPAGSYHVLIHDQNKNIISSRYFRIEQFIKPLFTIKAQPEKNVVWAGDSNTILVEAKFYDNTPVANTELVVASSNNLIYDKVIKTDSNGKAKINVKTSYPDDLSQNFRWRYFDINPKEKMSGDINTSVNFYTINHQLSFKDNNYNWRDGKINYSTQLIKLDLQQQQNNPQKIDGEILKNYEVEAIVERNWSEKIEAGESYDPIEKRISKRYNYVSKSETVLSQKLTSNNEGFINFSFDAPKESQYHITFKFRDTLNRDSSEEFYAFSYDNEEYQKSYSIKATKSDGYKIDEEIELSLTDKGEPIPNNQTNRHLIIFTKENGIINTQITNDSIYKFNFEKRFIPNISFSSFWFDGAHYHTSGSYHAWGESNLVYDYSDEEIVLSIKPDKEKYSPGDTVNLKVTTNDKNKQPLKARVLVSVIDESINDIDRYDYNYDQIVSTLYKKEENYSNFEYLSHLTIADLISFGAEGGGGGGDRFDFRNTAYFNETETGSSGEANISFKVPDNITSWRASVFAVNPDLKAGEGSILIPVTKDLFVNYLSTDEFLTFDKPTVTAVAYGDVLKTESTLSYSLEIPDQNYKVEKNGVKSFESVDFPLGRLSSGVHKMTLRSQSGNNSDGIVKYLTVLPTRQFNPQIKYQNIISEFKLDSVSDFPIKIRISPYGLDTILVKAKNININNDSRRFDNIVARLLISEINNQSNVSNLDYNKTIEKYRAHCGAYRLVQESGDDDVLSSKIIASGVDKNCGSAYDDESLYKDLNYKDQSVEVISSRIWKLSELTHNTNSIIEPFLSQENTPLGWLYLALASEANNDLNTAQKIMNNLSKYYTREAPFAYLKISDNKENNMQASALAMMAYAKLGDFQAVQELWSFLETNPSKENVYSLEKALTLKYSINSIPSHPINYKYFLNDKWQSEISEFTIYPDQQQKFVLKTDSPLSIKTTSYGGLGGSTSVKPLPSLKLSYKQINPDLNLYEITADYKLDPAFEGEYQIIVNLPSNLEFNRDVYSFIPNAWSTYSYPNLFDRHSLNFSVYSKGLPIKFIVKNTTKGEFTFEPGVIYHSQSTNISNVSSPIPIFISR